MYKSTVDRITATTRRDKIIELAAYCGEPGYRVTQIMAAIYKNGIPRYSGIGNIPLNLKSELVAQLGDEVLSLIKSDSVRGQDVEKVLFTTKAGNSIESVWMKHTPEFGFPRQSLCVSSQSGCALKCAFCYTGTMGLKSNLTADEICDQVLYFRNERQFNGSISFMGMGEPFANESNVFSALKMLTDPTMFNLGARKINISTIGIVPGIKRLTKEFPQVNLAFSLHTPFEPQRLELMPVTKAYPVARVFEVLDTHVQKTKRKVFISYVLMEGVNDSKKHARELTKLIKSRGKLSYLYHVNLIKFNGEGQGIAFKTSLYEKVRAFSNILSRAGVYNTLRVSFGLDIGAACGQLCARN